MIPYKSPVHHLSFSSIKEYCSDRQLFYKKYVLREWDENKWFNTLVGSGVHFVIEQFYKKQFPDQAKAIKQFVHEQYVLFLEGKVILNDDDINGRDKTDAEVFKEELELSIQRIIPVAMEYINSKMLFKMRGTEIGFKSQVGKALGFPHTRMQLKGIVDAITEDGIIIDWKTCSKFSPADKVEYMLQAINNALLFSETEGKLPKQVIFVEFLNTPSNADKVLEYEAKIAVWQDKKAAGETVRKPSPPKLKENEERYREHVISLDKWKFQVYLELIDRITREMQGENLLAQGLPIPSVEAKYGKYEGWQDFCTKILGYNPYTGEIVEEKGVDPLSEKIADYLLDKAIEQGPPQISKRLQGVETTQVKFKRYSSIEIPMTEEASLQKSQWQDKADEVTKEEKLTALENKFVEDETITQEEIQEIQEIKMYKDPDTIIDFDI